MGGPEGPTLSLIALGFPKVFEENELNFYPQRKTTY